VAAVLATAPSAEAVARSNAEPAGPGAVCVRFVDDEESAALNAAYRGKEGPTNVLSFPAEIDLPELRVWGDLVIAAPLVAREARDQGKAVADHCAHLVVHGVLHLLGYDHQDAAEADQFEHLERGVLARFGVADPYAAENAT
jgi:probable rRNA maturation factor